MTTQPRILLGFTAVLAAAALAGCASNSASPTKPADIQLAIKGKPLPADQMAKINAASQATAQAQQDKAKAAAAGVNHGPPAGH